MPVPNSIEHRVRMLIWGWAVEGYGVEDIALKLRLLGHEPDGALIWAILLQAQRMRQ